MKTVGRYVLLRELARGGQGAVYVARDPGGDREVALKLLLGQPDANALERFRLEAQALARLRHPNIVGVHDYGAVGSTPYLVLDLIDGESLQARLEGSGPLPAGEAARLTRALAEALDHAHTQGVIHRDLKPHNVLLARDGRPLLTDFGLAARLDAEQARLTQSGQMLGTPSYMAPEQVDGKHAPLDARTDVYGLGATLYALLTGSPPFTGASQLQVVGALVTRPPEPPRTLRPELDAALERICLRCLEKRPAARYASAAALADDLARYLAGDALRPRGRSRRPIVLAALCGLAVALAAALTTIETTPPEPAPSSVVPTPTAAVAPAPAAPTPFATGVYAWVGDGDRRLLTAGGRAVQGEAPPDARLQRTHRGVEAHFLDPEHLAAVSFRHQAVLVFQGALDRPRETRHGIDEVFASAVTRAPERPLLAVGGAHPATKTRSGPGVVALFELVAGALRPRGRVELEHSVEVLAFSPAGTELAYGTSGMEVGLLPVDRFTADAAVRARHPRPGGAPSAWVKTLAFDGAELLSGDAASGDAAWDHTVVRWELAAGALRQRSALALRSDQALCAASLPEGGYVIGTRNWRLRLLPRDPAAEPPGELILHPGSVKPSAHDRRRLRAVAVRKDDLFSAAWVGSADADGQVFRWDRRRRVRLAKLRLSLPARPVSLAISPDGERLAVGHSGPEQLVRRTGPNQLGRVEVLPIE